MWQIIIQKYNHLNNCYELFRHVGIFDIYVCIKTANNIVNEYCRQTLNQINIWKLSKDEDQDQDEDIINLDSTITVDNIFNNMYYDFEHDFEDYRIKLRVAQINEPVDSRDFIYNLIQDMK